MKQMLYNKWLIHEVCFMWMWKEEIYNVIICILTIMSWINVIHSLLVPQNVMIYSQGRHMLRSHCFWQFIRRDLMMLVDKKWQSLSQWLDLLGQNEAHRVQQHLHKVRFKYSTGWCYSCTDALVKQTWCSGTDSTLFKRLFSTPSHLPPPLCFSLPLLISSVSSVPLSSSPVATVSWH